MRETPRVSDDPANASKPVRPTWVMGHKNPDTDAICSALAYADLLRQTRLPDAVAACCGPPNTRTEWVLQKAGLPRPPLISDIHLRAVDICRREVATARATDPVIEAYRKMAAKHYRSLPVIDETGVLNGMLALQDLLTLLIPAGDMDDPGEYARQVTASTEKIAQILEAEIVTQGEAASVEQVFLMMVAGSSEPVMQDRIGKMPKDQLLIITGDRVGVQLHAVEAGVRCLVITSGYRPSEAIVHAASLKGTTILVTQWDTASTTQLIRGARSIQSAVSTDFISFSPETKIQAVKERLKSNRDQVLFPVCDPETNHLLGVFSRADLVNPERPRLICPLPRVAPGDDEVDALADLRDHVGADVVEPELDLVAGLAVEGADDADLLAFDAHGLGSTTERADPRAAPAGTQAPRASPSTAAPPSAAAWRC